MSEEISLQTPPQQVETNQGHTELAATPEEHLSPIINELQDLELQFEAQTPPHKVVDNQGFERISYDLSDGVSIIFRGREELPTFKASEGKERVVRGVVGIEERPEHTSNDDYGNWTVHITGGDPYEDVFERASQEGSDHVELIASSSPKGLVSAALKLIELGFGDHVSKDRLEQMKTALENGAVTDDIIKLYDDIFVASAVDTESLNMLGYTTLSDRPGQIDPNAPMIVVRALAGDPTARCFIEKKQAKLATQEAIDEQRQRDYEKRTDEDAELKQPGERLSDEELEILSKAHFVAVHTTEAKPVDLAPESGAGLRVMRPSAEYNKDDPNRSDRASLHWSLNHPVQSHISGNFDGRSYTIVTPLEDLARVNGAPGVLYGVDTYFVANPGEGMILPEQAVVLHTHQESGSAIRKEGKTIELKVGNYNADDIETLVDHFAGRFLERHKDGGWSEEQANYSARKLISDMLAGEPTPVYRDLEKLTYTDEQKQGMHHPSQYEISVRSQGIFRAFHKQGVDLDELARRVAVGEPQAYDELEKHLAQMGESIVAEGTIADYPELQPDLGEALRIRVVQDTIADFGGKIVKSDGMSAYIDDPTFQATEQEVAKKLGFRSGLHQYQPESYAESIIPEQLEDATTVVSIPDDLRNDSGPRLARGDFDWKKFDSKPIISAVVGSRVPWAIRRRLVSRGLLSYGRKQETKMEEAGIIL